jgi:DNA repair protein RadC
MEKSKLYKTKEFRLSTVNESEVMLDSRFLKSSNEISDYLRKIWPDDLDVRESAVILFLSRKNSVLGYSVMFTGGISSCVIDQRMVFSMALNVPGCCSIVLAHNHPSGQTVPSEPDKLITRKIRECGIFLDLKLLDHIILTEDSYYSFFDNGLI